MPLEKLEQPRVPELELSVVACVLKGQSIVLDAVPDRPYYVRFRSLQTGKTIQGMTHAKGTQLSPRFILQILERYDIAVPDFLEAVVTVKKGPQRV